MWILLLSSVLGILIARPVPAEELLVRYEAAHEAMGTLFTVAAYGRDRNQLSEVIELAFEEVDRLDAQMSNYRPSSELSEINRRAAHRDMSVEPRLFKLIQESLQYSAATGGAFDVTVGPLMKSWGFFVGKGRLPSKLEIAQILARIGYRHVRPDSANCTVRFDTPGVELDLGAIAKGYAVDRVVEILRSYGITNALVSSGTSSIYALGAPPGQRGWGITIRDPYGGENGADVLHLKNCSLSTSGSYEKFFKLGGRTYTHILDPRTGFPAENMLSTSVLALRAAESDALSTAFFVLGVEASRKYLATHPNLAAFFYQPASSKGGLKRVVLRSEAYQLPTDAVVQIDRH